MCTLLANVLILQFILRLLWLDLLEIVFYLYIHTIRCMPKLSCGDALRLLSSNTCRVSYRGCVSNTWQGVKSFVLIEVRGHVLEVKYGVLFFLIPNKYKHTYI